MSVGFELSGINLSGVVFDGVDRFFSIPGLIQLNELDSNVIVSGGQVIRIEDTSSNGNHIYEDGGPRRGDYYNIPSTQFYALRNSGNTKWSILRDPHLKGWNSILRQNAFGIFTIFGRNTFGSGFILKHAGNEPNKFWLFVNSSGAARHIFRNSANSETNWGSANNVVPLDNTYHAIDLICYGTSNNPVMEMFVDGVSVATRTTTNVTGSETANMTYRILETDNASAVYDLVFLAVYNWTGYNPTDINNFRTRVHNVRYAKYNSIL